MGRNAAAATPYGAPSVFTAGTDFTSTEARAAGGTAYPGSPPPTPFLADETLGEPFTVVLTGWDRRRWERVTLPDGRVVILDGIVGPSGGGWAYIAREDIKARVPVWPGM